MLCGALLFGPENLVVDAKTIKKNIDKKKKKNCEVECRVVGGSHNSRSDKPGPHLKMEIKRNFKQLIFFFFPLGNNSCNTLHIQWPLLPDDLLFYVAIIYWSFHKLDKIAGGPTSSSFVNYIPYIVLSNIQHLLATEGLPVLGAEIT